MNAKIEKLVPKCMADFLRQQSVVAKPSTIHCYTRGLRHFERFLKEKYKTAHIKRTHIADLEQQDVEKLLLYINSLNCVAYTKVNYLLQIRLYLAWELHKKTIRPELLDLLDRKYFPKVPEYLPRPLSLENDQRIIKAFRTAKSCYAPCFLLLRLTGLRISELVSLPRDCTVTNHNNVTFLKIPPGKMDRERLVPLSEECLQLIHTIKELYPLNIYNKDPNRLLGLGGTVRAVASFLAVHFHDIVGPTLDQGKRITFHRLRHTYATSLLAHGVGIVSIMKILGHRRVEMSLRYAKISPADLTAEYTRAILSIQKRTTVIDTTPADTSENTQAPADLLTILYAQVQKQPFANPSAKRTLLQRINRLKKSLVSLNPKKTESQTMGNIM
ncbi:MAG: site-specific integrase [Deltaproteobacteria bacterium]|nr:site-specific integrase [Deltaproteobacteria bacterium]